MKIGSAWQYDEASDEYYLHLYLDKQPDLNWDNPEVRDAVHDLMHFWLKRGCDGFRVRVLLFHCSWSVNRLHSWPNPPHVDGRD